MLSEPIHMDQSKSEEVWSVDQWDSSALCDDLSQCVEVFLVPYLQKYNFQSAASIIHALTASGAFSKVCQSLINQAASLLSQEETAFLYIPALLYTGEETQALRLLQEISQTIKNPTDLLLFSFIATRAGVDLHWDPLKALSEAEQGSENIRGVYYIFAAPHDSRSYERAISFYNRAIAKTKAEDEDHEDYLAQRAIVHMMRRDYSSAENDLNSLLAASELDSYLPLYLTFKWVTTRE